MIRLGPPSLLGQDRSIQNIHRLNTTLFAQVWLSHCIQWNISSAQITSVQVCYVYVKVPFPPTQEGKFRPPDQQGSNGNVVLTSTPKASVTCTPSLVGNSCSSYLRSQHQTNIMVYVFVVMFNQTTQHIRTNTCNANNNLNYNT